MEKIILILPLLLGFIIGFFYKPSNYYKNLKKPYIPSGIVFSIVWFILYILIGISYYIALKNKPLIYWILPIVHLILNLIYTPLLFGYNELLLSSFVILLTLISAIMLMILFYNYDKSHISYKLLIPYIIWLIYANYLSWSVYSLN